MNLAACFWLFACGATLAACGSSPPKMAAEPDAAPSGPTRTDSAARERDVSRGVVSNAADAASDAADPGPDVGREPRPVDAAPDTTVPAQHCSAGHTCTAGSHCERACFNQLVYRCSCVDGRFVCTGCISIDGGARDVRGGPPLCAADVSAGQSCKPPGAVCQERGDGAQRLCACGDVGADNVWICQ